MSESEIQSAVPDVLGGVEVVLLLRWRHSVPHTVSLLVAPDVIQLRPRIEDNEVETANGYEYAIATPISRSVIRLIDIGCDHGAQLHEHVVQRGIDGAACHST